MVSTGAIRLDPGGSKNGRARTAYLEPDTLRLLVEQRERVRAIEREQKRIIADVFVHVGKKHQGKRIQRFRKAFYTAAAAAVHPGVLLHDLPRSGVRSLIRSGVPERVAMEISGHKTRAVFNTTSEEDLKDAASRRAQLGTLKGFPG